MSRRSIRHPFGGRLYPRRWQPGLLHRRSGRRRPHQPRLRPRRSVNVAALVASPEEVPSRPRLRMRIVGAIVLVLFAVMALRLWSLQVIQRRQFTAAVNANVLRAQTVPAPRGLIVDRRDTVLAGNKVENELVLTRAQAQSDPSVVGKIAALAGVPPSTVDAALNDQQYSPYEPVPVLVNASAATVQYLEAHQSQFPGVSVEQVTVRDYPQGGTTATQVLGYAGPITATALKAHPGQGYTQSSQIGKTGVEAEEERFLRGRAGRDTVEVAPAGTIVGTVRRTRPSQGDTVALNLTTGLQKDVQSALNADILADRTHTTFGSHPAATNGAAVVMNVETGAVLALTSYPSYSLTEWVGGISTANYDALRAGCNTATGGCPLNDYAIQGLYTPGSTFKLSTATAALQDGLIGTTSTIDDTGTFDVRTHGYKTCIGTCVFHDATAVDAGIITVRLALTESDDFFFYTLGLHFWLDRTRFGQTAIQKVAQAYGFGEPTGIDLPGEVPGRVDSLPVHQKLHKETPKGFPSGSWYPGTNIEMAFGQGGTVITPIEMAQAYATFADDGVKHEPQVVGAVVSPGGKVVKRSQPKVTGHVTISPGDYQALQQGFVGVTHTPKGTAYQTFQQDSHVPSTYVIAGKTGTATVGTAHVKAPNAWFVGFGPLNAPTQYVVAVAVAQGGYGAAAAAPAVANIFNYLYANPPPASLALPTATSQPSLTPVSSKPPAGTPTSTTTTVPATTVPTTTTTVATGGGAPTTTTTTTPPATTTTTTTAPPGTTTTTVPPAPTNAAAADASPPGTRHPGPSRAPP